MTKAPGGPKMPGEQNAPKLTVEDVQLLASFIAYKLDSLEKLYPFLSTREYPIYRQCRYAIETEGVNPTDQTGLVLGSMYASLVIHLREISEQRASMLNIRMPKNDGVKLEDYFPATFPDMVDKFRRETEMEMEEESVNAAADAIIMGELKGGIFSIAPNLRCDVREQIIEILLEYEDPDGSDESVVENLEPEDLSEACEWTDEKTHLEADWRNELDETSNTPAVIRKKLARAISAARDGIDNRYGENIGDAKQPEGNNAEAFGEVLWKRVLRAAGQKAKEVVFKTSQERRAELAAKIYLPLRDRVRRGLRVVEKDQA